MTITGFLTPLSVSSADAWFLILWRWVHKDVCDKDRFVLSPLSMACIAQIFQSLRRNFQQPGNFLVQKHRNSQKSPPNLRIRESRGVRNLEIDNKWPCKLLCSVRPARHRLLGGQTSARALGRGRMQNIKQSLVILLGRMRTPEGAFVKMLSAQVKVNTV